MTHRRRILLQHVKTDQLLGVDAVPLGQVGIPSVGAENETGQTLPPAGDARLPTPDGASRIQLLEELDLNEVRGCTKCVLCQNRTQTVFGEGDAEAKIMFIGEGPGQREDESGRPFVGRAGALLEKEIAAMGLQRSQVYIANAVKCRPPNNRTPATTEVAACSPFLQRQIQIIRPTVIITLGGPAAKLLLDIREGITRARGKWFTYDGLMPEGPQIPVMPTFHPAYLLRSYTAENRRRVWSDLQKVMERVGL